MKKILSLLLSMILIPCTYAIMQSDASITDLSWNGSTLIDGLLLQNGGWTKMQGSGGNIYEYDDADPYDGSYGLILDHVGSNVRYEFSKYLGHVQECKLWFKHDVNDDANIIGVWPKRPGSSLVMFGFSIAASATYYGYADGSWHATTIPEYDGYVEFDIKIPPNGTGTAMEWWITNTTGKYLAYNKTNWGVGFFTNLSTYGKEDAEYEGIMRLDNIRCGNITDFLNEDFIAPTYTEIVKNRTIEFFIDKVSIEVNATDENPVSYYINDSDYFNMGVATGILINDTLLLPDIYHLTIQAQDPSGNKNYSYININVTDTIYPSINYTDGNVIYGYSQNYSTVNFSITASDYGLVNNTLYIYHQNMTLYNRYIYAGDISLSLTFTSGTYFAQAEACDLVHHCNSTDMINFTVDLIQPQVNITVTNYEGDRNNATFSVYVFDDNLFSVNVSLYSSDGSLIFNNYSNESMTGIYDMIYTINSSFVVGNYTVRVTATDAHHEYVSSSSSMKASDIYITSNKITRKIYLNSITMTDMTPYSIKDYNFYNKGDGYSFYFEYASMPKDPTFIYNIRCDGITYLKDSPYKAHFVCPRDLLGIDFENDRISSYDVISESDGSYTVYIESPDAVFNSIFALHTNTQEKVFFVYAPPRLL